MYPVHPLVIQNLSRLSAANSPFLWKQYIKHENQLFIPVFHVKSACIQGEWPRLDAFVAIHLGYRRFYPDILPKPGRLSGSIMLM